MTTIAMAAIATLGPSSSGTLISESGTAGTYQFTVKFSIACTTIPIIIATLLQGTNYAPNIADTFAITIVSVSTTGFTVNINRVDSLHDGWAQNLQLQYMGLTNS